jgi:hypothetical protein
MQHERASSNCNGKGEMDTSQTNQGNLIAAGAGVVLIILLFLPWASVEGADNFSGWQVFTIGDIFFLITGLVAIAAALTAGGVLLPGLSWNGAATLLGGVATILMLWVLIFDWFDGTSRTIWVFLALIAAAAIAVGAFMASDDRGSVRTRADRA